MTIWSAETGPVDAPLVGLIHGSMDRSTGMLKLGRLLEHRYRVLRYDRRGYGRSTSADRQNDGPFHMRQQVADLFELLQGRPVVLVAHSYGGNVALAAAAQAPEQVKAVALYESPMSWEPWWPGSTGAGGALSKPQDVSEAVDGFMRRVVGDQIWDRLPESTRETRRAEGPAMLGELVDLRRNQPWQAADISCPVMIGYGSRGRPHHQEGAKRMHEILVGSTLVCFEDVRHDAPMSSPKQFVDLLVTPVLNSLEW